MTTPAEIQKLLNVHFDFAREALSQSFQASNALKILENKSNASSREVSNAQAASRKLHSGITAVLSGIENKSLKTLSAVSDALKALIA